MTRIGTATLFVVCILPLICRSLDPRGVNTGLKCECAGFKGTELSPGEQPLLVQNPLNTTCDETGETTCKVICLDLARVAKERAPEILCIHLKHAQNLQPSMYTRVCQKKWKYANLTAENTICCQNGKPVKCD